MPLTLVQPPPRGALLDIPLLLLMTKVSLSISIVREYFFGLVSFASIVTNLPVARCSPGIAVPTRFCTTREASLLPFGVVHAVEPLVMDVLLYLGRNAGKVISREEMRLSALDPDHSPQKLTDLAGRLTSWFGESPSREELPGAFEAAWSRISQTA